jgi:hypothetical protein
METTNNIRLDLLNDLIKTPHRDLDKIYEVHKQAIDKDPLFYRQLSGWAVEGKNSVVRDNNEMFIINLLLHPDNDFREVGLAMYRNLPVFQCERVVNFIHKKKKNIPNSLKTETIRYLREREEKPDWLDSNILHGKKSMKRLYALMHIAPSERAQAILFDNTPPEDSDAFLVKKLVKTSDPSEQAQYEIPKGSRSIRQ